MLLFAALFVMGAPLSAADAQAVPDAEPQLQAGQIVINHQWQTIALKKGFVDPIVVVGPTNAGLDPSVVQINNVTPNSFQVRVQEWAYLDGATPFVLSSFLAVERGATTLPSGAVIEAGSLVTGPGPSLLRFDTPYAEQPAVLSTAVSDGAAVAPRMAVFDNVVVAWAQSAEAAPPATPTEVNWVAWPPGFSSADDPLSWQAGSRAGAITHNATALPLSPFLTTPCVFAAVNSFRGGDPGQVRHGGLDGPSVELRFQEEQSRDLETIHVPETLALVVVDCPATMAIEAVGTTAILNPAFEPTTTRYSIHPGDSGSELLLNFETLSPSDLVYVEGQLIPHGTAYPLDPYAPGDTANVQITGPTGTFDFEVFLLPDTFPYILTYTNTPEATASPLLVTANDNPSDSHFVILMDNNGVPYGYRNEPRTVGDFKRHASGQYSYNVDCRNVFCDGSTQFNAEYVVLNANFEEEKRFRLSEKVNTDIHDHLILDNGDDVVISWEEEERDLTPFGGGPNDIVQSSIVQQQDQDGNIIFEWNSWDGDTYKDRLIEGKAQYAHMNSVFYTGDDMLVSLRGTSQIINVDRTTGDVNWRLGGLSNDFTFINDPLEGFCGQHTASFTETGNLLLFDNGTPDYCIPGSPERGEFTRIVEYELDLDAMTATLVWSYAQPGAGSFSFFAGSSQRLPNGNTLIGWGGRQSITGLLTTEVTPSGEKALEIVALWPSGDGVFSYRTAR